MTMELDAATADLQTLPAAVAAADLCGWWARHGNTVKRWARKLQRFPFALVPGARQLGRLIEQLALLGLDRFCALAR